MGKMLSLVSEQPRTIAADSKTQPVWRPFEVLSILFFSIVFVNGYSFGVGDHNFYVPQLQAELDPSLYPGSTAVLRETSEFSFFNLFLSFPIQLFGLQWTFFLIYLIATYCFYFCCSLLADKLFAKRWVTYGFLLLMLPFSKVPGTATTMWEHYLTHRGIALPLCLFGLYQVLCKKHPLAYLFFGIAALIHPITAAFFAIACFAAVLYDVRQGELQLKVVLLTLVALFVGASPLIVKILLSGSGGSDFFAPTNAEWAAIVHERAPYMLPLSWSVGNWSRGSWFLLFFLAWYAQPRRRENSIAFAIVGACGFLLLVSMIVGSFFPFMPLARFEFARSLFLAILFARLYVAAVVVQGLSSHSSWVRAAAILCGLTVLSFTTEYLPRFNVGVALCGLMVVVVSECEVRPQRWRVVMSCSFAGLGALLLVMAFLSVGGSLPEQRLEKWVARDALQLSLLGVLLIVSDWFFTRHSSRWRALPAAYGVALCLAYVSHVFADGIKTREIHLPEYIPATPWVQTQLWAKANTAKDAIFMVSWTGEGFSVFSQRGIVGDWKSGGDTKFSYAFARQWQEQKNDLADFDELTTEDFCRLKRKYNFQYIVTKKKQLLHFPLVYDNSEFSIYYFTDPTYQ